MSNERRHVIIVGAGPAGAALAHFLATRNVRVTLLERQTDFAREFRGEALSPSGVEVLDQLQMDDVLEKVPQVSPEHFELYSNRKLVLEMTPDDIDPEAPAPRIYSQPALLEAIVGETLRTTDLVFERGASVKELLRENGRVVGVRVRTAAGERRLMSDLVIGCDGRASVVRRDLALEVSREDLPMDVLWSKIPAPSNWKGVAKVMACIGNGHLLLMYVNYEGLLQLAWVIRKGSFGELRDRGFKNLIAEVAGHGPVSLADHLIKHSGDLVHPFLLSTAADCVSEWSSPGALVLGDAAHTMSPVAGQGINIALRDTVVAANHLAPVLRSGGSAEEIDAVAKQIEIERMPEVSFVQDMQSKFPRIMLQQTRRAAMMRRVVTMVRFAPVRALAARGLQPFMFGTSEVKLNV